MEPKDFDLFDRYLDGKMTAAEMRVFEQMLHDDKAFSESFNFQKDARLAARLDGREDLKNRLRQRNLAAQEKQKISPGKNWILVLAGLLLLVALFFLWKKGQNKPAEDLPHQEILPEKSTPGGQQKQSEPTTPGQPIAEKPTEKQPGSPDVRQVFAANFDAFQSNEISGMLRADDSPDAFQQFVAAYLRGEHNEALRLFEDLSAEDKSNENIQFLKANSLLAVGKTDAAITVFEKISAERNGKYALEAQWFLGLAKLKKGDLVGAETIFRELGKGKNSPYQAAAALILKQLKNFR
ncbi:MAG: tetratricopeptide repeat protein [Lewinellaceae bacterium]|nr:tetratricopeptide repeat protein [Lewinellaceae bacterium]